MKRAIADGRESFVQWDTGRYVTVDGASVTEIHFAHPGDTSPVTVPVRDGRAAIPDTLLATGMSVIAYARAADGTGSYTVEERVFPVRRRPKPDGYIYTPAEKRTLEALEARVAALEALSVAVEGAKAGQLLKIAADSNAEAVT